MRSRGEIERREERNGEKGRESDKEGKGIKEKGEMVVAGETSRR